MLLRSELWARHNEEWGKKEAMENAEAWNENTSIYSFWMKPTPTEKRGLTTNNYF